MVAFGAVGVGTWLPENHPTLISRWWQHYLCNPRPSRGRLRSVLQWVFQPCALAAFHYRLDLVEYSRENYEGYMRVNDRFAEQLQPLLHEDDLVWVHDYHFIPLAREFRKRRCRQRMGFFLHIPWPSKEVLTALPDHLELVEALLEFDVIGFQTKSYVLTFLDYVVRELGGTVDADGSIYALGKRARVQHFPISIETQSFTELADQAEDSNHVRRLVQSMGDKQLILGVDRLDYSKGLFNRFKAYEHLLQGIPSITV